MSQHLISINGVDFTGWVSRKTYQSSHSEEGFSWKDINLTDHRIVQRTRVSAAANLIFFNDTDYQAFLAALGTLHTHTVLLYVETLGAEKTINAQIKYTTKTVWTAPGFGESAGIFSVTIEVSEL